MSRLPVVGQDDDIWGEVLNDFLSVEHNNDGTLKKADAINGAVQTINGKAGPAVTITASDVGAATDSTVLHKSGAETVAGTKTFSTSPIVPDPTSSTHAANKNYVDSVVATGSADATTTSKGVVQLAGDLAGTATAPTVPGLAGKADKAVAITGATSLTGGGDLSANRSLALVNDAAAPGNDQYYGTDATGIKGYHSLPVGDPTMGGDLTGTASNAQIAPAAVGTPELADNSVTEPKLDAANAPGNGQVLSWNGTNFTWVTPSTTTGYVQGSGIAKITVGTTAPSAPAVGDVWINT